MARGVGSSRDVRTWRRVLARSTDGSRRLRRRDSEGPARVYAHRSRRQRGESRQLWRQRHRGEFLGDVVPAMSSRGPRLVKLQDKYKAKGLTVVGLSLDTDLEKVRDHARRMGINYPIFVIGPDHAIQKAYAPRSEHRSGSAGWADMPSSDHLRVRPGFRQPRSGTASRAEVTPAPVR